MEDYSGSGKLIRYSFYSQSSFLMKQKKSRLLSFAWVVLILSLMVFTSTSYAGNGDDLVEAAYTGNLSKVRALLKNGVDVDHKNSVSEAALMAASQEGHEAIVQRTLLAKGAKINHQAKNGVTALIIASQEGHETIVQTLCAGQGR
jgi:ankyrin repeat protein